MKYINNSMTIDSSEEKTWSPPILFVSFVNRPKERERNGEFQEVFLKLISQTPKKGLVALLEK